MGLQHHNRTMVYLTAEGMWEAAWIIKKYETIKGFLTGVLRLMVQ